jgi:endo-1,3(4)-beta-glucanase
MTSTCFSPVYPGNSSSSVRGPDLFGEPQLVSTPPPWERRAHDQIPSQLFGSTGFPFPTNVWWQNMVLDQGDLVNVVDPYIVKTTNQGLHVCLPDFFGSDTFYGMAFVDNLVMSSTGDLGSHSVSAYDELSVTVAWSGGMTAPMVRGMPYATAQYTGQVISLRSDILTAKRRRQSLSGPSSDLAGP